MSINLQVKNDIKEAMRSKDKVKRDTLRNIQAVVKQIEVDERREVTDSDMEAIFFKYLKQREDAKIQFMQGNREDLVAKEDAEINIIKHYLPKPMSDDELNQTIKDIIASLGASSMKDMGKVMTKAKAVIGRKASGGRINGVVKSLLS